MSESSIYQQLHDLTEKFSAGLPDQLGAIESAWTLIWRVGWESATVDSLIMQSHSLAGTAGSLGFKHIAQAANELQVLLKNLARFRKGK